MKIYLASPLGFSEVGRAFYTVRVVETIRSLGFEVLDPWSLSDETKIATINELPPGPDKHRAWAAMNVEIGRNNQRAIDSAEAMFAILDGVDVDSGTAAEIGYGYARGLPIVGYRGDFRLSSDNEGAIVNLQVQYFIEASGGTIIRHIDDLPAALSSLSADQSESARP